MFPYSSKGLPIEIVIDILSRLPVKTLVQSTSVCKSWYSLIKNPQFITTHLFLHANNYNGNNSGFIVVMPWRFSPCDAKYSSFILCANTLAKHDLLDVSNCNRIMFVQIVNSCNGVICFTECYPNAFGNVVTFWNPSIRKFKALPVPQFRHRFVVWRRALGFGYDHRTNDYKVVRILYFEEEIPPEIEVYSFSTDSWRRIEATVDFMAHCNSSTVPFLNGAIHWLAGCYSLDNLRYSTDVKYDFIMSFYIGDEVFQKVALPVNCLDGDGVDACVMEFKELLSLFVYFPYADYVVEDCYIWVMSKYGDTDSWSKQFTIRLSTQWEIRRPMGFTKNGNFMFENDDTELILLDPENLQVRNLGLHAVAYVVDASYTESLVLLEEGNANLMPAN